MLMGLSAEGALDLPSQLGFQSVRSGRGQADHCLTKEQELAALKALDDVLSVDAQLWEQHHS